MISQFIVACAILINLAHGFMPMSVKTASSSRMHSLRMMSSAEQNQEDLFKTFLSSAASAVAFSALMGPAFAVDYAPSAPPPSLTPQVTRQSPKAVQPGVPEKWIYSKFLDEVEKDHVEKVTFSPDGKKAVGVDDDGDRFTCDIPNDPNLLSFLVQHKVEINVAPINANGGTGAADAAALVLPESEMDRLIQTFAVPGVLTSLIFLYPTFKLLFPSKEERDATATRNRAPPPRGGGGRGGGGGGRGLFGGRGRGPGGMWR